MALTNKLTAIGNAIRAKNGETALYTLDEMPQKIAAIEGGGGETGDVENNHPTANAFDDIIKRGYSDNTTFVKLIRSMINHFPDSWGELNWSSFHTQTTYSTQYFFKGCYSLRSVSPKLLAQLWNRSSFNYSTMFENCYSLDEVIGMPISSNSNSDYNNIVNNCYRLKRFTFGTTSEDLSIHYNSVLDFSNYVGWANSSNKTNIIKFNSGITADKEVTDAASYELLKNNPDWFTTNVAYSRYNKISATETINSLPNGGGGTAEKSTIKFKGEAGSLTDGGAINTLTEEEIAVAVAKQWTVAFV